MTQLAANRLVERGAKLLDTKLPGWHKQIKLNRLDLSDGCRCVLGQLGQIKVNLDRLSWHDGRASYEEMCDEILGLKDDSRYGFNNENGNTGELPRLRGHVVNVSFDELQNAWEDEIRSRRAADRQQRDRVSQ